MVADDEGIVVLVHVDEGELGGLGDDLVDLEFAAGRFLGHGLGQRLLNVLFCQEVGGMAPDWCGTSPPDQWRCDRLRGLL
jgi:hypothetical protein